MQLFLALVCLGLAFVTGTSAKCTRHVFRYDTYGEMCTGKFTDLFGTPLDIDPMDILKGSGVKVTLMDRNYYFVNCTEPGESCRIIKICFCVKYVDSLVFDFFDENGDILLDYTQLYATISPKTRFTRHCVRFRGVTDVFSLQIKFGIHNSSQIMYVNCLKVVMCCD